MNTRFIIILCGLFISLLSSCETPLDPPDESCELTNTCGENTDDCADAPCANGGECLDGVASFTCECPAGYEGDLCEVNINDCADAPCANGGDCAWTA